MGTEKRNRFRAGEVIDTMAEPEVDASIKEEKAAPAKKPSRKNKSKDEPEEIKQEQSPEKPIKKTPAFLQRWFAVYHNERSRKLTGLVMVLMSAYLAIALISYFFTWDTDQDKVLGGAAQFFSPET